MASVACPALLLPLILLYSMLRVERFHHITNEVLSVERTKDFYMALFGFEEMSRPNLKVNGAWLEGLGVHLHLIEATNKLEFEIKVRDRLDEFERHVPYV